LRCKNADFNNDGDSDIAVANDNIENKLFFGSMGNNFDQEISFGSISPSRNLEIADIDNDGDLDLNFPIEKLKYEYELNPTIINTNLAKKIFKRAVEIYNYKTPHYSLKLDTPKFVHSIEMQNIIPTKQTTKI